MHPSNATIPLFKIFFVQLYGNMSSWFSDLAGKAENILNKIDQNAASVLKNDANERDQLLEVKTGDDVANATPKKQTKSAIETPLIRGLASNSMKLQKTSRKALYSPADRSNQEDLAKIDSKLNKINAEKIASNASNSSRRSSCSSRTEGIQTVIEYPISKHSTEPTNTNSDQMHTSASSSSLHSTVEDKTEMLATRIVVAQLKAEHDQMRTEITDLKNKLAIAQKEDLVSELTAACDQLATDKEHLQRKLEEFEQSNNGYGNTISELEISIAKLNEVTMELREKLSMAKTETEQAVFELQQYRSRAQHTLQMKDQLIGELKSMHQKNETFEDSDIDAQCKQIELVTMKQERDSLLEEINVIRNQLNANKQVINTLENKLQEMSRRSSESEKSLANALREEKLKSSQMDETIRTKTKELKAVRDELKRQQGTNSAKLHEKYISEYFLIHKYYECPNIKFVTGKTNF